MKKKEIFYVEFRNLGIRLSMKHVSPNDIIKPF